MKHNFIKKLIAASVVTSSVFSIYPVSALPTGINYSWVVQTNGQWAKYGEKWYYYLNGQLQKGWICDKTGWYYADQNGVMQTGVLQIGGKIYLFADSGVMQTGSVVINGKIYIAGADGVFYGENLPMPTKAYDSYGQTDKIKHPSQVVSSSDGSSITDSATVYDPLAPKEKFQITFKDDDGENLRIRNVKVGDTVTLYKPTKKGSDFVEWNTKKNGDGDSYDYDDEIKIKKNIALYAVWEEVEASDNTEEQSGVVKVEDITILPDGKKKEITSEKGTLRFRVDVLPVNADNQKVDWSVESETGTATISSSGLLTAEKNGVVIVKATAKDGSGISDTIRITISGQTSSGSSSGGSNSGGSNSGSSSGELPVISGEESIVNNSTSTELMKGNTYSTIRLATNNKETVLENIKVNKLVINGGDSIILDNCEVNYIEVLRPGTNCTITIRNGSSVQIADIGRGVTLVGNGYKTVNIDTDEVVTIDKDSSVDTLNVNELKSKIRLDGAVTTMNIASGSANSVVEGLGTIGKLVNDALNVKLGVAGIDSIIGSGENTNLDGLIDKAKELEEITKQVESIEKANSTDNSELIEKIQAKINETNPENPYKSDYEKLKFRLEKLNDDNSLSQQLKEARKYVIAFEKAVGIDPTSTVKFTVGSTSEGNVEIVYSQNSGMTIDKFTSKEKQDIRNTSNDDERLEKSKDDMCAYAQYFVDNLTPGLVDKESLQRRINSTSAKVVEGKKLRILVSDIKAGNTEFTVNDYKNAGITSISSSNLKLANKYLDENRDDLIEIPTELTLDNNGKENNYTITDVINKNKELINKQISEASETIKLANIAEKNITSANSEINKFYTTNSLVENKVTLENVEVAKKLFDAAILSKKNLDDYMTNQGISSDKYSEYVENYNTIKDKYEDTKVKVKESTLALCRKEINGLYVGDVIDKYGNVTTPYPNIISSLTTTKIQEIDTLIKKIENEYSNIISSEELVMFGNALINANKEYNEFQVALKALENNISIAAECSNLSSKGGSLTKSEVGYTYTFSFSAKSNDYVVDSSYYVTRSGLGSIFIPDQKLQSLAFDIKASGGIYYLASGQKVKFEVANVLETIKTDGSIERKLQFTTGNDNSLLQLKKQDNSKTYDFKVDIDKKIVGDQYICILTITRN